MTDDKRQPIPVERLLMTVPKGISLPTGPTGENLQLTPMLKAGMNGNIKIEIEYRPWMRAFRVRRLLRDTHEEKGKIVETFKSMGRPYFIPDAWCTWVPVEEI